MDAKDPCSCEGRIPRKAAARGVRGLTTAPKPAARRRIADQVVTKSCLIWRRIPRDPAANSDLVQLVQSRSTRRAPQFCQGGSRRSITWAPGSAWSLAFGGAHTLQGRGGESPPYFYNECDPTDSRTVGADRRRWAPCDVSRQQRQQLHTHSSQLLKGGRRRSLQGHFLRP